MTILIAGAGPSGLTLALSLSRQGIPYHLLDCGETAKMASRADLTLSPRSLEIFETLGIGQDLMAVGHKVAGLSVGGAGSSSSQTKMRYDELDIEHKNRISLSCKDFLSVLEKAIPLQIDQKSDLKDLVKRDENLIAQLNIEGKVHKKAFQVVVGCDGAVEIVRHILSFHTSKNAAEASSSSQVKRKTSATSLPSVFVTDVLYEGSPSELDALHFLKEGGFTVISPLAKDRLRLTFSIPPKEKDLRDPAQITALLKDVPCGSLKVTQVLSSQTYEVTRSCVSPFREGNVFFCGRTDLYDLSRLAFGLDLDMQKAFRLGCFLGQNYKKMASDHILETYDEERRFFRDEDQQHQKRVASFFFSQNPILCFLKSHLTSFLFRFSLIRQRLLKHIGCLNIRYRVNQTLKETFFDYYVHPFGPKKGDLAPDGSFVALDGKRYTVSSLLKNFKTVAMIFSEKDPVDVDFQGLDIPPEQVFWISSFLNDPQKGTLHDKDGEAFKRYGVKNRSLLYIIRPDGHIADRRLIF